MNRTAPGVFLLFLSFSTALRAQDPEPDQIAWQPSLAGALEIAKREHRPLLVAVNMDAESASERIVREQYKNPRFVASTRRCVCVIGSIFRHNPRDFDDSGRRIPCPRLGCVTCGEHIELESVLFDQFLGGERIAPRHALIDADGNKVFDLSLLFDLRDLERQLEEAVADQPLPPPVPTFASSPAEGWRVLFRRALRAAGDDA